MYHIFRQTQVKTAGFAGVKALGGAWGSNEGGRTVKQAEQWQVFSLVVFSP